MGKESQGSRWLLEALARAKSEQKQGVPVSRDLAYCFLDECKHLPDSELCRQVQFLMVTNGLDSITVLSNHLIRLLVLCTNLVESNQAFTRVVNPDRYTWSAIIDSHAKLGQTKMPLDLYLSMQNQSIKMDRVIFLGTLRACCNPGKAQQGRCIHEHIIESGLHFDIFVANALIDMYCKCISLEEGRRVFCQLQSPDVVSWNALLNGYVQHGESYLALECFEKMQHSCLIPDTVTYLSVLKACGTICVLPKGRTIHSMIDKKDTQYDVTIGTALIDMYAKCAALQDAQWVFDRLLNQDAVSWGALVSGYAQQNGQLALEYFKVMQHEGINPDKYLFSSILKACGRMCAIESGRYFHRQIIESGQVHDIGVANALIDMYSRCGSLEEAQRVFINLSNPDVISWGAIIAGYAQLGEAKLAVECFEDMQCCAIVPNDIALTNVLAGLSRAGLVDEALYCLKTMNECHGIKPDIYHIACLIDLLGHVGHLNRAEDLLSIIEPDTCVWTTLLNACKMNRNINLGKQCFNAIVHEDPIGSQAYAVMSNIYAGSHGEHNALEVY